MRHISPAGAMGHEYLGFLLDDDGYFLEPD